MTRRTFFQFLTAVVASLSLPAADLFAFAKRKRRKKNVAKRHHRRKRALHAATGTRVPIGQLTK